MSTSDPTGSAGVAPDDALDLLRADHQRMAALLDDLQRVAEDHGGDADRSGLVASLGALLQAHAQIEQELVYPALPVNDAAQAREDHAELQALLLALVEGGAAGFGLRLGALARELRAHLADEEQRLFPLLQGVDRQDLGQRLATRRAELMGPQGVD